MQIDTDAGGATYLYVCEHGARISWLTEAMSHYAAIVPVSYKVAPIEERITKLQPQAIFLDFSGEYAEKASELAHRLRRDWPEILLLGTGVASHVPTALQALRAGVHDFVDVDGPVETALETLHALFERHDGAHRRNRGRTIALLGARAGLGVTTLACNLAVMLQDMRMAAMRPASPPSRPAAAPRQGVALLDLGLPPRDGLLYLDIASEFSFVEGAHNLRRLDQTLIQTALAHHASGVALLPLPASLAQIREISHAESAALIRRLADFFEFQVADLGGFSSIEFVAQATRDADRAWVVCDQSVGGIVSTAQLLRDLRERGVDMQSLGLIVNRYDAAVNLTPRDIAERLGLPLVHVLPARATALLGAGARGELIAHSARSDPYVQAVGAIARGLVLRAGETEAEREDRRNWGEFMSALMGKFKG